MTITSYAIDTSALAAVVLGDADARRYAEVLARHPGAGLICAPTLLECQIVVEARVGPAGGALLSELLQRSAVEVVSADAGTVTIAMTAWRRFGKGHHAAALNFGDCFSYALAKGRGIPLLYKGDDFAQTDIAAAL